MENIINISKYTESMKKTLYDKIWWIDKISDDIDTIIDFGCADGSIMLLTETLFPKRFNYIGIDNNKDMLFLANNLLTQTNVNFKLYSSTRELDYSKDYSKSILIMNSVIHELLSYCTTEETNINLYNLFNLRCKHIAIRDMFFNSPITKVSKIRYDKLKKYNPVLLQDYEYKNNVSARDNKFFIEFLLKYRYVENWNREVYEHYLWDWKSYLKTFSKHYSIIYENSFSIPFIKRKIKNDFKINLKENTHLKILLDLN